MFTNPNNQSNSNIVRVPEPSPLEALKSNLQNGDGDAAPIQAIPLFEHHRTLRSMISTIRNTGVNATSRRSLPGGLR